MNTTSISIVIPVLDEADHIGSLLKRLPNGLEVIVVDGGSKDSTVDLAFSLGYKVISSARGRAIQMNAGAAQTKGEVLVFLHADCMLPRDFDREISVFSFSDRAWGRFDVRIDSQHVMFRIIERMINLRSRLTGICTGDQAIFVRRSAFEAIDGLPVIPLMEDIDVSKRLKKLSRPYIINSPVQTSARRWLKGGIFKTILMMWRFRFVYFFGASSESLAQEYYG